MASFVVIANRLPVDRDFNPDGSTTWRTSPGGLVSALEPVMRRKGGAWIGWHGAADERLRPFEHDGIKLVPTFHPAAVLRGNSDAMASMRADLVRAKKVLQG